MMSAYADLKAQAPGTNLPVVITIILARLEIGLEIHVCVRVEVMVRFTRAREGQRRGVTLC
jgi:hypothetical protein